MPGESRYIVLVANSSPLLPRFEAVEQQMLSGFHELVEGLGGNAADLLSAAGIDIEALKSDLGFISYRQIVQVTARAAKLLNCPDFGLRLAAHQNGRLSSPLINLMKSCVTLGDALNEASAHSYAHSPSAAIWIRPQKGEDSVMVGHDILLGGLPHRTQVIEQVLLIALLSLREVAGGHLRARQIHFRHLPVSPRSTYRRYFGCEVIFGEREDAILLGRADLATPTAAPDPAMRRAAAARIDAAGYARAQFAARVRGAVMHALGTEHCTNAGVAEAIDVHVRLMHRLLSREGTSFQRIKNEVRRDLALYYLMDTNLGVSAISSMLGFAEQSALTSFCRKWLDASPSLIRFNGISTQVSGVQNEQV